jgi:hypothetical protein
MDWAHKRVEEIAEAVGAEEAWDVNTLSLQIYHILLSKFA